MKVAADVVRFFKTPAEFRSWLEANHAASQELWVGYYKKDSKRPSITWQQSVDQALCFGWIDGLKKRIDDVSYKLRFTPRRKRSAWSAINIRRVGELKELGLMQPAGLAAFEARTENKSGIYSYEQRKVTLEEPYAGLLKANQAAWDFFNAQPPGYRKTMVWWVMSARQEATRLKRTEKLIHESAARRRLQQ